LSISGCRRHLVEKNQFIIIISLRLPAIKIKRNGDHARAGAQLLFKLWPQTPGFPGSHVGKDHIGV
jgi:hypothetical protein